MSKHFTPGPWVAGGPSSNIHILEADRPHMRICFMTSDGPCVENANLIAAAPDLLLALRRLLDVMGEGNRRGRALDLVPKKYTDAAEKAVAKALGKPV